MKLTDAPFFQSFIRICDDAYLKGWHERNGGNLTYRMKPEEVEAVKSEFRQPENWVPTEVSVPNLAGEYFLVTGSGKYLRNVSLDPEENSCIAVVDEKGENYRIVWGMPKGGRPTSEFPTHLLNLSIKKDLTDGRHRVIYHPHPTNAIALTFVLPLEDRVFSRQLWTAMNECSFIFPEGVGVIPWMIPGGRTIALATAEKMKEFNVVFWPHHGIFCSGADFDDVFGLTDAVEKSAEVSMKVLAAGGRKNEIPTAGIRNMAKECNLPLRVEFLD